MVLHKYTTVSSLHKVLSSCRLRFSSPLVYNDPFDGQWNPLWQLETEEGRDAVKAALRKICDGKAKHNNKSSWAGIIDHLVSAIEKADAETREPQRDAFLNFVPQLFTFTHSIKNAVDEMARSIRFFCLSESDDNSQMWSHYADQHKGVVASFDKHRLNKSLENSGLDHNVYKIDYRAMLPRVIDDLNEYAEWLFHEGARKASFSYQGLYTVKHVGWQYEKEWRFAFNTEVGDHGLYTDVSFDPRSLVAVTAGCRTSNEDFRIIAAMARAMNPVVEVKRASIPTGRFALEIADI